MGLHFLVILGISALISLLALIYVFLEKKILAKSQQRYGPNRTDHFGFLHGVADILKLFNKGPQAKWVRNKYFFALAYMLLLLLPYLFYILLHYPMERIQRAYGSILGVYSILFLFITVDTLFLFAIVDSKTRLRIKRNGVLSLLGITLLLLASVTPLSYVGMGSMVDLYLIQNKSPFLFLLFKDPCAFFSSLVALASFFFIIPSPPFGAAKEGMFHGFWYSGYQLSRTLWMINLFSLWIGVYAGGFLTTEFSLLAFIIYLIKLSILVVFFMVIQQYLPLLRINDSIAFALNKLFPIGCVVAILQIVWVVLV